MKDLWHLRDQVMAQGAVLNSVQEVLLAMDESLTALRDQLDIHSDQIDRLYAAAQAAQEGGDAPQTATMAQGDHLSSLIDFMVAARASFAAIRNHAAHHDRLYRDLHDFLGLYLVPWVESLDERLTALEMQPAKPFGKANMIPAAYFQPAIGRA